jgi:hypothetical protein
MQARVQDWSFLYIFYPFPSFPKPLLPKFGWDGTLFMDLGHC